MSLMGLICNAGLQYIAPYIRDFKRKYYMAGLPRLQISIINPFT